ncbi:MAG TPA: peptide deformylase [Deltaproteobacteria bacterium]|nr:MAG: peptide deformylase [Deltaproteobacteria bacterium GWA2_55_82]OGQ63981.1 MAG: peptide deformylase [Deltaproteobacteria bacterium RIFCSPLOWO2_02_FULL_55_12]OIJ73414.1 MAG: peptide deformylase [Deltaproteobacteria bacterium GWC2_55_46]HBG47277.1 peptide deformylase [Deltaproteobacteria bacterium]HCY10043.1 peptide deformylase [Deltaproteobacteria bacterium]
MGPFEIRIYPDPVLKELSSEVREIDAGISSFIDRLVATLRSTPGVGLAAPQVGELLRIIAIDVTPKNPGHGLIVLINPVITSSTGIEKVREGCLSVPDYTANIQRAKEVEVKGLDRDGKEVAYSSSGLEAIAFQHEIDHLDGILFLDRIANMKRDLFRRKIKGTVS